MTLPHLKPQQSFGGGLLLSVTVLVLLGPALHGGDPDAIVDGARYAPPSAALPLGADELGRDEAARLFTGGRYSLSVALLGAALGTVTGLVLGLIAGWKPGTADEAIGTTVDVALSLPIIALVLILAAADPGKIGLGDFFNTGAGQVVRLSVLLGMFNWMAVQRVVRAQTRRESNLAYAEAARAAGAGTGWLLFRVILPAVVPTVLIYGTYLFGQALIAESTLSYLGMGISPPTPTWGNLLQSAQEYFTEAPLLAVAPGILLVLTALGVNLLGGTTSLRE